MKLPAPLAHLANRPHGRYRLSCPVEFAYRGGEAAAQAASGAVRYDISLDPAKGRAASRRARKRSLTAGSSSRWAGAITRTSEDAWQLAERNLRAGRQTLRARVRRIEARLAVPAGGRKGHTRGYGPGGSAPRWRRGAARRAVMPGALPGRGRP